MRHLVPALFRLQTRLLALLVLVVAVALGTVAIVARASATAEFERYVEDSRQDMQLVAQKIAATTGDRLLVTSTQGRVILDSSGELVGQTLSAEQARQLGVVLPPKASVVGMPQAASYDVVFISRSSSSSGAGPPPDEGVWTHALPAPYDALASRSVRSEFLLPAASPSLPMKAALAGLPVDKQAPPGPSVALDNREQVFINAVTRSLLVGVLVGAAAAVVLAFAFARGILRPIGALTSAAQQMERGDLSQRVVVTSNDEIGQLAHAFNAMAGALARTEQLRRTMVADVAHELRTPLTNLRGYLEALRDGVAEPRRETIDSLYEEALLLAHLVDDLQELSLSDAGRLGLRQEPFEAAALLNASALALAPQARERGVELVVEPPPVLPLVYADSQRIGQVLRNLLTNALTYTPPGGTVRLRAEPSRGMVKIAVQDTGCGIEPEHVPNVFERFYRADPSRARSTGGAGIGLALVKQFVDAHGGTVDVVSAPGRGSCFSFTVPTYP
jgi:signal transduction histidine kinase